MIMAEKIKNNAGAIFCKVQSYNETSDGDFIVYGWASQDNIDSGNEIVPINTINNAVKSYANFGNIRQMHNPFLGGAGVCKTLIVEDNGLWIEANIVDKEVIDKIKKKVYKGFSIGYIVNKSYKRYDGVNVLTDIELIEISVVDRPMNEKCLLESLEKIKELNENSGGNDNMTKVVLKEDKDKMPDDAFAYVGEINGKNVKLFPYKKVSGDIDIDLAISSINILNSNRPEDVEFLSVEEKNKVYDTLVTAIRSEDPSIEVPELIVDNEFGNKFDNPLNLEDAVNADNEISEVIKDSIDKGNEKLFKSFKKYFTSIFKKASEPKKKIIEVEYPVESIESIMMLDELKNGLRDVVYFLDRVLYNILYDEQKTAEEKEILAIQAFNDAKSMWLDLFRQVVATINETQQTKQTKNKVEDKMEDKTNPKVTEQVDGAVPNTNTSKDTDINQVSIDELLGKVANLEKENSELKEELETVKSAVLPSAAKLAEDNEDKKENLSPDNPRFWI
jgi:HK97 family phage prohead protease